MGMQQWLSNLIFGNTHTEISKTESQINVDNGLKKDSDICGKIEAAKIVESEESKIRRIMITLLWTFDLSPEGQAATILLNLTKKRVFITDGKPAIKNFFFYGPKGFENSMENDCKSYEIDEWALVNFLYIVHEARLAVSGTRPTVESAKQFCFGLINNIRTAVNAISE